MFACFRKSDKINVTEALDLIDTDGNNVLSQNEVELIAHYIHHQAIENAQSALQSLQRQKPKHYLKTIVGKTVSKAELRELQHYLPESTWKNLIIPELKRREIQRLQQ